jgi:hypothetical protein
VWSFLGATREFTRELTETQVLRTLANEVKRRRIPETCGPAVTEQDFVAVGQIEECTKAVADLTHFVAHSCLSVRRSHVRRAVVE